MKTWHNNQFFSPEPAGRTNIPGKGSTLVHQRSGQTVLQANYKKFLFFHKWLILKWKKNLHSQNQVIFNSSYFTFYKFEDLS